MEQAHALGLLDMGAVDDLVAAHPGRPEVLTSWMDPSVTDESDVIAADPELDPFYPDNGPPYSPAFVARYRAASQRVRAAGVQVARSQALLDAAQVLVPGAFVVVVTWLAARFAVTGRISTGDLVAFYGYAAFLTTPLRTLTEALDKVTRALVASGRLVALLRLEPALDAGGAAEPDGPPLLQDVRSGLVVRPGVLTAVAAVDPAQATAVAERLGRYVDDGEVRIGGTDVRDLPLAELRRRVMVVDQSPLLFSGPLRDELGQGRPETAVRATVKRNSGNSRKSRSNQRRTAAASCRSPPSGCSPANRWCTSGARPASAVS
jgi:ABC-type transport system involved in Fe-S cluster assembly fused permease/ATPase subunit